jgi:prevent-host-death family protein
MERIGIRELRQNASKYVRRVQDGEMFEVTDRGRPVARIVPLGPLTGLDRLRALGQVTDAKGDLRDLPPPLPLPPGARPPSEILLEMREEERF